MCTGVTMGKCPNALQTVLTSFLTFLLPALCSPMNHAGRLSVLRARDNVFSGQLKSA